MITKIASYHAPIRIKKWNFYIFQLAPFIICLFSSLYLKRRHGRIDHLLNNVEILISPVVFQI